MVFLCIIITVKFRLYNHTVKSYSEGLEFDTVFLIGAQEGILPDLSHDNVDLDEEANLAYVASTRAKENLFISYPRHNSKSKEEIKPSRYFAPFFP